MQDNELNKKWIAAGVNSDRIISGAIRQKKGSRKLNALPP